MARPPFSLTPRILNLVAEIQETLGELRSATLAKPSLRLRKENRIKTIRHSLAIEGNSLSEEQITALLENKRVVGPKKQIQEVRNAVDTYELLASLDPMQEKDLLKAHSVLMRGLTAEAGKYRSKNVGILKGTRVGHVAPQPRQVPHLMKDLFAFLKREKDLPLLIRACVFHYELEFIHPFEDGNGRMGRLWQQSILMRHSPVFEFIAVETLIHAEQKRYYHVLEDCDRSGDSGKFIEFSLDLLRRELVLFQEQFRPSRLTGTERIAAAIAHFEDREFTRKDYLGLHREISTATASRDLAEAVEKKNLLRKGEKARAVYRNARR